MGKGRAVPAFGGHDIEFFAGANKHGFNRPVMPVPHPAVQAKLLGFAGKPCTIANSLNLSGYVKPALLWSVNYVSFSFNILYSLVIITLQGTASYMSRYVLSALS